MYWYPVAIQNSLAAENEVLEIYYLRFTPLMHFYKQSKVLAIDV